jgi:hypothetical protein
MKQIEKILQTGSQPKSGVSYSQVDKFNLQVLEQYAPKSLTAAKFLQAKKYFLQALQLAQYEGTHLVR